MGEEGFVEGVEEAEEFFLGDVDGRLGEGGRVRPREGEKKAPRRDLEVSEGVARWWTLHGGGEGRRGDD